MTLQGAPPVPPTPGPPFDPNLMLQDGGFPPLVFTIVMLAAIAAATAILWPIVRAFGRRLEGKGSADSELKAEVDHLHARLGDVDALQARILELEERVDFTERLLAQAQQSARLGLPTDERGR